MATATNKYMPDYAVPPGWVIEEHLATRHVSQAEFARRCGRSPKLISEIIAGRAPIGPTTAVQFEKVLGVDASIWLGIEADYRLHRARHADAKNSRELVAWAKTFPIEELVKRGAIGPASSESETVQALLSLFGVASKHAWEAKYGAAQAAYRHSPSFESDGISLKTWLRLAEIDAEGQDCADYRKSKFRAALLTDPWSNAKPHDRSLAGNHETLQRSGRGLGGSGAFAQSAVEWCCLVVQAGKTSHRPDWASQVQ